MHSLSVLAAAAAVAIPSVASAQVRGHGGGHVAVHGGGGHVAVHGGGHVRVAPRGEYRGGGGWVGHDRAYWGVRPYAAPPVWVDPYYAAPVYPEPYYGPRVWIAPRFYGGHWHRGYWRR
ncbi:MAG TPA: hypothetical protein VGH28_21455 [Polyangiaceae bacterium]